jgi:isopenicillin-N epimerase
MTTRRSFLREIAAGAALLQVALDNESLAQSAATGEEYWRLVRAQFSFTEAKVPMNAANLCPSPRVVADRVTQLTADLDRDVSFQNRAKFSELLEASRKKVARQMGVSADEIALVRNTSEANNTINAGLPLSSGDEVIVWNQNHPTNNVAWDVRAARYGSVVKRVSTPAQPRSAQALIDTFTSAFTPRTRVLAITHLSNLSGIRLPVRELVEAAHARDIYVHVDGAQSWGALDVNLRDIGCDSYSASTHKWFMGPKEAGLLYVKADNIPRIWPSGVAPGWGDDVDPDPAGARKFESLGQRDDACLAAIGTAADFHDAIGPARIEARTTELTSALKAGIAATGLKLVTPMAPELSGGVCIVSVDGGRDPRDVMNRLYQEHGIAGAPTGGLRLSPHTYNTMEHIERAVAGVKALLT